MFRYYFILLLVPYNLAANSENDRTDNIDLARPLISQAVKQKLSDHPYWLKLLHYKNGKSEITSKSFFVSADGAINPTAELRSTLISFFDAASEDPNSHSQCRFIARFNWLKKNLDWSQTPLPKIECHNFLKWSYNGDIKSLSLIFASGYLENPASFYGHLLVKFNTNKNNEYSTLLDQSINFGAIVPDNENPIVYIFKGLFGGYDSAFSHVQFYRQNHNYTENELRDLWEYKLTLNKDEVDQIVTHSWELLGQNFTYFFHNQNCGYRLGELLELVIDQPMYTRTLPWTMPSDIIEHINNTNHNKQPLVSDITLIPSRQNRFYANFEHLTKKSQIITKQIVDNNYNFDNNDYQSLQDNEKIEVINTLIDYNKLIPASNTDKSEYNNFKYKILAERLSLPSLSSAFQHPLKQLSPPNTGPLPTKLRTSYIHHNQLKNGIDLEFRIAYFDFLNLDQGRLPYSNLTMSDLTISYIDNKWSLQSLDLINIEALNYAKTSLPSIDNYAWKVKVGFQQQSLDCFDCTVFKMTGAIGKSSLITDNLVIYALIGGFIQSDHHDSGTLGSHTSISAIARPLTIWKTKLDFSHENYINGLKSDSLIINWENRFGSSRNWDVRLNYKKQESSHMMKLGYSVYW